MNKIQFIEDLKEKDIVVKSIFFVSKKELKKTRQNKDYLFLTLKDKTGELSAFLFENVDSFKDLFEEESYIFVEGITNEFNQNINLRISKIEKVDESNINIEDFLTQKGVDGETFFSDVLDFIDENVKDKHVKKLIGMVLSDPHVVAAIKEHPAALKMHHAIRGGLVEHVLSMLKLSKKIVEHYRDFPSDAGIKINEDLLYAGVIFHDIGKMWEISGKNENYSFSDEGKLLGHISIGFDLVSKYIDKIPEFPSTLKLCILHLILSHHGEREYGSPVTPKIPEALILHYVDNLDAKLYSIFNSRKSSRNAMWTSNQNALRKEIFIGCSNDNSEEKIENEESDGDEIPF